MAAADSAARDAGGAAHVSCRFTHVYPDGPAPYYTVLVPARRGVEIEQWAAIKTAVSEVISPRVPPSPTITPLGAIIVPGMTASAPISIPRLCGGPRPRWIPTGS